MSATALAGVSVFGGWALPICARPSDDIAPFSFERLIEHARYLATTSYQPPEPRYPELLNELGYETFMGVHANRLRALWHDAGRAMTVEFFHLDQSARVPVLIHVVDAGGDVRRLEYDPELFRYDDPGLKDRLPADLGFAGFRVRGAAAAKDEWVAFKGASYFRSPGELNQYGLSARGVAVDTGFGAAEDFPRFSSYWLLTPQPGDDSLTVCALLEGRDLTGAYRIRCHRHGALMDVESRLFQRRSIRRLGIAPLTSMFWYSETNSRRGIDWRPEIHDSDGLAMATGDGERLWRALDNPPRSHYSAFMDHDPKGFGLLQRDRAFDHYQDARVHYERRPSLWVEPRNAWGRGHVGLLELATDEEIYDNINAFWVPEGSGDRHRTWRFNYRLYWSGEEPFPPERAHVVATRVGRAGSPGSYEHQPVLARKFVIDFEGGTLPTLDADAAPDVRATASHGRIVNPYAKSVAGTPRWRAFFDWSGNLPPNGAPVELRCSLARDDTVLTETWLFAYFPQALPRQVPAGDG